MSGSEHTAIGQALGYMYQFERATYRLLQADNTVVYVGIEHVDDVSVHKTDGTSINEQNKATIGDDRPLTDRSVALWKTLAIWADIAFDKAETLSTTEFHLVTNGEVDSESLAARIHAAKTSSQMTAVASELRTTATALREGLQPFAAKILRLEPEVLARLVGRIFVFDNISASYGGKLEELQSLRFHSELQRRAIFDGALGWVKRTVLSLAQSGEPTLVDRIAFDRQVKALNRSVAVSPLFVVFDPQESGIDPTKYRSHGFVQQLDWVDTDPSFVRQCVIHYVHAQAVRVKWADSAAVPDAVILAYEEDLKARWRLNVQRQSRRTYSSPIDKGQELLNETLSEDSVLENQPMPKPFTCGSFHVLADFDGQSDPKIGWHPEFDEMAKATKDEQ